MLMSGCLRVPHHQVELAAFGTRSWTSYRELLASQRAPTAAERLRLEEAFDALVEAGTTYAAWDDRVIKTADFQTLAATAANLGVGFFHYRISRSTPYI